VRDFKAAAICFLECFAQDTSQSARECESWSRIARLVDKTEPSRVAALADTIVSAIGADNVDKLGVVPFLGAYPSVHPSLCHPALDPRDPLKSSFGHLRNSSWTIRSSTQEVSRYVMFDTYDFFD
jgi:hypothetical protein